MRQTRREGWAAILIMLAAVAAAVVILMVPSLVGSPEGSDVRTAVVVGASSVVLLLSARHLRRMDPPA